ncbi:hypothetical protein M1O17_02795 [Dehalococcoidia bacterium]|nr:hypothetical protein [Dehalococcoidia bacterium]
MPGLQGFRIYPTLWKEVQRPTTRPSKGFWIAVILSKPSSGFIGKKHPMSSVTLLILRDIKPGTLTFITYSSKTIEDECSSRNLQHYRIIGELVESLAGKPLVLDREFSYEKLFENMVREGLSFVIRLNMGNRATITDE